MAAIASAIAGSNICQLSSSYNITENYESRETYNNRKGKNQERNLQNRKMSFLRKTSIRIKERILGKQRDGKCAMPPILIPAEAVSVGKNPDRIFGILVISFFKFRLIFPYNFLINLKFMKFFHFDMDYLKKEI